MQDNGILHITEEDALRLVNYFDMNTEAGAHLYFQDFMSIIIPCTQEMPARVSNSGRVDS